VTFVPHPHRSLEYLIVARRVAAFGVSAARLAGRLTLGPRFSAQEVVIRVGIRVKSCFSEFSRNIPRKFCLPVGLSIFLPAGLPPCRRGTLSTRHAFVHSLGFRSEVSSSKTPAASSHIVCPSREGCCVCGKERFEERFERQSEKSTINRSCLKKTTTDGRKSLPAPSPPLRHHRPAGKGARGWMRRNVL